MIAVAVQQADLILIPAAGFFLLSCRSAFQNAPTKTGAVTWCVLLGGGCAWYIHSVLTAGG